MNAWKLWSLTILAAAATTVAATSSCDADTADYRSTRGKYLAGSGGTTIQTVDPAHAQNGVKGRVLFSGDPPPRKPIGMSGTPECARMHENDVLEEKVVVNPNGTLKNCFVYVDVPGRYVVPEEAKEIDQAGCVYEPHVMGIQVDQTLLIKNSDEFMHNVHINPNPKINEEQNYGMPTVMEKPYAFEYPEVMVRFKCEVHPWMGAWVGVLEHPFYVVTGDDGSFEISGLPPGSYDCVVWHEKYKEQRQRITVEAGKTAETDFTYRD